MSEAAFTSPRSQRALKRLTVDMDKHKEILNRLNQQSSKLSELRKGSPYSQQSQPSPYARELSEDAFEEEGDDIELPWQKQQQQQQEDVPPSRETMEADALVEQAVLAAENAARKKRQQRIEEADRKAKEAKERRASREAAALLAKEEADLKAKEEARRAREAAAAREALEADEREREALRLREEEAEKRRLSDERRRENEQRRIASQRRAKEEVFKVRAAAEALVRKDNEEKERLASESKKEEKQKWYEKKVPVVEYTAEQLPEEQREGRPMSTYRNGWSSTPHMNNKDAYNRDVSGFTSQGLYAWNHYLPKPPSRDPPEEKVPEPPVRDYEEDETEEEEEFFVAESPDGSASNAEEFPAAVEEDDDDVGSVSSTDSEAEPEWQQTWRRRSEHRRIAFTEQKARKSDSLEYDGRDRLVDDDEVFEPKIRTTGMHACDVQRDTKLAVSEACRSVASEDLDAEVTSFDAEAGLFRVSCTVKVGDGRVVSMATLRDFGDFHKVRADILACLDKIPGGRATAQRGLPKLPKKRLRSLVFAKSRNLIKGKNKGEFKWQAKQLPVLDAWLTAAIAVVAKVKAGDPLQDNDATGSKFSFVSNFSRLDLEDSLKCFLLQGAFFAGVMTMTF